ncbi:hypothetical protein LS215_1850 [Sulfolobus islandicus L.S.2.15]|uniref:Uncharacterized protein n=1 Tax=Saccharolobus islandicus (strain L.S.2.15 / Lassen \|nr:hypothetical protein [Sulfolobus islandicus]ACP35846.1 hypothetical protein LS215_1850 [Sulfolobus islandicus L.S.2.15]
MYLKIEREDKKVIIYVKNPDNEIEPIEFNVEIDIEKFDQCVKNKKGKVEDPELDTAIEFALYGECLGDGEYEDY